MPVVETFLAVDERGPATQLRQVGGQLRAGGNAEARDDGRDEPMPFHATSRKKIPLE
jgi:hypothetical protein